MAFFLKLYYVCVFLYVYVLHAVMQSVVKSSARVEPTAQWSEQMPFPLKLTSLCKKEDVFCVEEHMFTWAMTCLTLDWCWLAQSVETTWWVISNVKAFNSTVKTLFIFKI